MRSRRGFTLLELIVALAIVAIILTVLTVSLIKHYDRIAQQKENAAIKSIGTALKESVRRARYVPDENAWASMVSTHLGWQIGRVTVNDRSNARIFLIDPTLQIGTNSLPYSQSVA
ncbi:MAG TPA: type II secretion system protein, partial [Candidatus Kapabacteria bacterium]|nr:type II secretion system protein [Candidatus Kapabacteria bacterium]